MRTILAAVIVAALSAPASASSIDGGWCGKPSNEPTEVGQGMAIDDAGIAFIDTVCTTISRESHGDTTVLTATCTYGDDGDDDGESWEWSASLQLAGDELIATMDDGTTARYSRCDSY